MWLGLALFFSPALLGAGQFSYRDAGRMHAPVKRWLAERLGRGELPEWNPYGGLGYPEIGAAVDAVQHPLNALFLALPFEAAWTAWVLLCYPLAAAGAWLWARRLGRSHAAAAAAGLGFALSGHLVSSSDNATYLATLAAVPWMLAAAQAFGARGGPGRLALVGAAAALAAAGGDAQGFGLAAGAGALQAALAGGPGAPRRTAWGRGLAAAAASLAAAAPFLLPVALWLPHSARADPLHASELARFDLAPLRLLELLLPGLTLPDRLTLDPEIHLAYAGGPAWVLSVYLGASAAALAMAGAFRARAARFLGVAALATVWMALGRHGGFGQIALHLPLLGQFRYWEKLAAWPALLLALAAAFGVDAAREDPRLARRLAAGAAAAGAALLAAGGAAGVLREGLTQLVLVAPGQEAAARLLASNLAGGLLASGASLLALALVALAAARPALAALAGPLFAAVVALDLGAAGSRDWVLSPAEVTRPRSPFAEHLAREEGLQRVVTPFPLPDQALVPLRPFEIAWLFGARSLAPAWNVPHHVGNFEAYTALVPARALRYRKRAGLVSQIPGVGLWGVGWVSVPGRPPASLAEEAPLAAYNLRPPYDVAAVDPGLPAWLARIPRRPRAYLAEDLAAVDRRAAMEFVLDDRSASSTRSVVEGPVPPGYAAPRGAARIAVDRPERVEVDVAADGPALLVLNDAFAAGWSVTVDGTPAEILPANYLARGVWVGAGAHRVEFAYRTPGLREGWAVFLASGAALAGWGALRRRGEGRRAAEPAGEEFP
jgi:hypothetical protein